MPTFALVFGGVLVELSPVAFEVNPNLSWVDVTEEAQAPQVGWGASLSGNSWSFVAPSVAAQTPAQTYSAWASNGLTITSAGSPAINGLYAIDDQSLSDISSEAQFITTFSEFTNGATSNLSWIMSDGTAVTFPTTSLFLSVAKAIAMAVAAAKLAAATKSPLPPNSAAIP